MTIVHAVGFGGTFGGLAYLILALRKAGIKFDIDIRLWRNGKKKDDSEAQ